MVGPSLSYKCLAATCCLPPGSSLFALFLIFLRPFICPRLVFSKSNIFYKTVPGALNPPLTQHFTNFLWAPQELLRPFSTLYANFLTLQTSKPSEYILKWETELSSTYLDDVWYGASTASSRTSKCINHIELSCKIHLR